MSGPATPELSALVRSPADEMRRRWELGEPIDSESLLDARPGLRNDALAALDVVYEEYCLRLAAGEIAPEAEILRRFPEWADRLQVLFDCHRLLDADDRAASDSRRPTVGETIAGFELVEELGRGAGGQVFLATQAELANRPVVVKISALNGSEHLLLAQLQHTNIVPIHAAAIDRPRGVRLICMPYLGRTTLAVVRDALQSIPPALRSGEQLSQIIALENHGPALAHGPFATALCRIAAALADALQFAHDRNLVHFDLKPENILLAAGGAPMLLDFHLAQGPIGPGDCPIGPLGGTLQYMAPEQRAALAEVAAGRPVSIAVDHRADIYGLGAVLCESLGGDPLAVESSQLPALNPQVSVGLADILAKCLHPRPEHRYETAAALADDLRRHVDDRPLVGVPNRKLTERWRKWRRRRPGSLMAATALVVALSIVAGIGWQVRDRGREAEQAHLAGQEMMRIEHYEDAIQSFDRGLGRIDGLPFHATLAGRLRSDRDASARLEIGRQLHVLAEELRGFDGIAPLPPDRAAILVAKCRELWSSRELVPDSTDDWQDVALFAAKNVDHRAALAWIDEAESALGASAVLAYERNRHCRALGLATVDGPADPEPRTARAIYALGRSHLASDDLLGAMARLERAVALDPAGHWPNFYFGLCAYRLGRFEAAVTAFSVCIGNAPVVGVHFHNRGLAYAALGAADLAQRDFDEAVRRDPNLTRP